MKIIKKKILPNYFQDIWQGKKSFELRLADWECGEGDILILQEHDGKEYTGREVRKKVGSVLKTKELDFFTKEEVEKHGFQVISLLEEKE